MNGNCFICPCRNVNCNICPKSQCTEIIENSKRINKQTRTFGSLALYRRKALVVSRQDASKCLSAGGPGDKVRSIEGMCPGNNCEGITYRLPIAKTRTANKGKKGVDVKHNSYNRYLARRVGNVLDYENKQFNESINKKKGWQQQNIITNPNPPPKYEYKKCTCKSKSVKD